MPLHVEVWDARSSWLTLSISDRIAYLDRMASGMQALTDAGTSLVGMVLQESNAPCSSSARYVAVWSMPDQQAVQLLDRILTAVGWRTYFTRADERRVPVASKSLFEFAAEREPIDRLPSVRRN